MNKTLKVPTDSFCDTFVEEVRENICMLLRSEYKQIEKGEISPDDWCRKMMMLHMVEDKISASFLKSEYGISVVLPALMPIEKSNFIIHNLK